MSLAARTSTGDRATGGATDSPAAPAGQTRRFTGRQSSTMIFRPRQHSMSLKRAHELLKISRSQSDERVCVSKLQIQTAFRSAALLHHPDLRRGSRSVGVGAESSAAASSELFRECSEARELLLDYYVRHKFVPKNVVESTRNVPHDDTLFSVWTTNRSLQLELFLRYATCLALAIGTYYHDKDMPARRKRQVLRRDEQFSNFGPRPGY